MFVLQAVNLLNFCERYVLAFYLILGNTHSFQVEGYIKIKGTFYLAKSCPLKIRFAMVSGCLSKVGACFSNIEETWSMCLLREQYRLSHFKLNHLIKFFSAHA